MQFLKQNKRYASVGDDFVLSVDGKEIPGSDFIETMQYLMNPGEKKDEDEGFYTTTDVNTKIPLGTRRFVGALFRAIEKEPVSEDM